MALISEQKEATYKSLKIKISEDVLDQAEQYKSFGDFQSVDRVIEKACDYVFSNDKDFRRYIESLSRPENKKE